MKMKRHCDLCDHQTFNLKKGSICGATKRKPDFNGTCVRIEFNNSLKEQLEELHINLEDQIIMKKKFDSSLILNPVFGLIVVAMGYYLWKYILNKGFIAFIPASIIAIGLYIIRNPFTQKKIIKNEISIIKGEINEIKNVLKLYQVSYEAKVEFTKEVHGKQKGKGHIKILK
ncbi:hypothetical protein DIS07_05440 [Polaribacter aquimarinus]|uniref:Uncharacterized protein n=2 Tax=Polaribacter aquimarinus TaxID=2100726 RepID=A0A2U2JC12_9FLAO|nr:hypothetical protein DIS07_05440 [Polaribacter aquimarinus]